MSMPKDTKRQPMVENKTVLMEYGRARKFTAEKAEPNDASNKNIRALRRL
jgi:hypothetical protein